MAEASEPAPAPKEEAKSAPASAGLLGGMRGWIILIAAVVLEAVGFMVILHFQSVQGTKTETPVASETAPQEDPTDRYGHVVKFKDMNFSVPTPGGTVAPLAMELVIRLGYSPEELRRKVTLSDKQWAIFEGSISAMEPLIRDRLNIHIRQQTWNQLNSVSGQEKIKEYIKEFINNELEKTSLTPMKKAAGGGGGGHGGGGGESSSDGGEETAEVNKRRVIEVLIPMFYLQS